MCIMVDHHALGHNRSTTHNLYGENWPALARASLIQPVLYQVLLFRWIGLQVRHGPICQPADCGRPNCRCIQDEGHGELWKHVQLNLSAASPGQRVSDDFPELRFWYQSD